MFDPETTEPGEAVGRFAHLFQAAAKFSADGTQRNSDVGFAIGSFEPFEQHHGIGAGQTIFADQAAMQ